MLARKRKRGEGTNTCTFYKYYGCSGACVPENIQQLFVDPTVRRLAPALCDDQKFLVQVFLPIGLKFIGKFAFRGCEKLQKISVPYTVERIEQGAFWNCSDLTTVNLSEGLLVIGSAAFLRCIRLGKIKIPSTVTVIEQAAFQSCIALRDVELQDGLEEIQQDAFDNCKVLQHIKVPSTVEKILDCAFERCERLRDVEFSDSSNLKEIGAKAFKRATALSRIRLPSSVEFVDQFCFQDCVNLVTVEVEADVKFDKEVFRGCKKLTNIKIAKESTISSDCFTECKYLLDHYGEYNVVDGVKSRFGCSQAHILCYKSHSIDCDELREAIASTKVDGEFKDIVDTFGRTPFHILASSASADKTSLLAVLLDMYPSYILGRRDKYGFRAIHYLERKDNPDVSWGLWHSMILQKWIIERLFTWGREHWISKMATVLGNNDLCLGVSILEIYETHETLSLLELWLWRMQILVMRKQLFFSSERVNRAECKSLCGASFVIPTVMEFLGVERANVSEDNGDEDQNDDEGDYGWQS